MLRVHPGVAIFYLCKKYPQTGHYVKEHHRDYERNEGVAPIRRAENKLELLNNKTPCLPLTFSILKHRVDESHQSGQLEQSPVLEVI